MTEPYDSPHQFDPLMPSAQQQEPLLAKAHDLSRSAFQLAGHPLGRELRTLLRGMNSYYTNRIEGQHTRPYEIERALRQDFSNDQDLARRQRLAIAHIDAEAAIEARYMGVDGARALYSVAAIRDLHRELFARLPLADLLTPEGQPIEPGQLREVEVRVGLHVAPTSASVLAFIDRWARVYGEVRRGEASLVALAAAQQRLGWIHPFIDGNGRVMRLHTHAVLNSFGFTNGLWSPLRGFARSVDRYYQLLQDADEPRRGDLDGRGNLSEQSLVAWIHYVLDVCIDQVQFMSGLLDHGDMKDRIAACLSYEREVGQSGIRMEALQPLHYLFLSGDEIDRADFKAMLPGSPRLATSILAALLHRRLLKSDSPRGKVRFAIPYHALRFYFPALWPEAEADSASEPNDS